jgi:pimeloyl-ACP methyl ester carboxylesterase
MSTPIAARWGTLAGALALLLPAAGRAEGPPRFADLTPAVRQRVDRAASEQPPETFAQEAVNFAGNLPAWVIGQVALSPEEEAQRAAAQHKEILAQYRSLPTPAAVGRVWDKLLEALPPHFKPDGYRYTLTVLDMPEPRAFATGAGSVYVSRALLDSLPEGERGTAALGFVLAGEIGHTAYGHCRRGWQLLAVQEQARQGIRLGVERRTLEQILQTSVETAGRMVFFLYTREQQYDADLCSWGLCQNAGFAPDATLDALRFFTLTCHPALLTDPNYRPGDRALTSTWRYYLQTEAEPVLRLKRLLREQAGLVDNEESYGLFAFDRENGRLTRCAAESVGKEAAPVVVLHGLRGDMDAVRETLEYLGGHEGLARRPLLMFRYPSNESLPRCAVFLSREMKRVIAEPARADFVAHSAGGLVFRWYAEVLHDGFGRAVFLGTPHAGSNLAELKFILDVLAFTGGLKNGFAEALAESLPEGRGAIGHDLHPDSLFLRRLGRDARLARRYHVISGRYLSPPQARALRLTFAGVRTLLRQQLERIESPLLRQQAGVLIERLSPPPEITRGDLAVTEESACLPDAGRTTRTNLHHLALKSDREVLKHVAESLLPE